MQKPQSIGLILFGLVGLLSCSNPQSERKVLANIPAANRPTGEVKQQAPLDTTASFRIGWYWITPTKEFAFNVLEKADTDTLEIVSCGKYIIDPFGPIANKSQIHSSLLKDFLVKTKYVKQENGTFTSHILTKGSSRLVLDFETEPDASASSYVFKGEIRDSTVKFASGVRVGMSTHDFYSRFFKVFPEALQTKYKIVVFDYCVDGIRHTYEIKNNKLFAVKFSNPGSFWKVDY